MKLLLRALFLFFLIQYVPRFCHEKTDGFKISNIHSDLAYDTRWEVDNPPLPDVFNQTFTYLASGGQAYAFLSDDGETVIKFFKHHLRRPIPLIRYLPLTRHYREKNNHHIAKRKRKLLRDFTSYKLSMENLRDETGLLYVHLNKSTNLEKTVTIVDKIGIQHTIDLDSVGFVLQKRAELAFIHLLHQVQKGKLDEAKEAIDSICELIISRCEKGVYDEDPKIHRNFGFVDNRAILVDVGRLRVDLSRRERAVQIQDLYQITKRLRLYLKDICPQLADYLDATLEEKRHVEV